MLHEQEVKPEDRLAEHVVSYLPIDIGFDLRVTKHQIKLSPFGGKVKVCCVDGEKHVVLIGTGRAVAKHMKQLGYNTVSRPWQRL